MKPWIRFPSVLRELFPHAVSVALLVGLTEAGIISVRQTALHQFVWSGPDVIWMAPAAYLILFLAGAGLAAFAGSLVPWLGRARLFVWVISAAGIAGILRLLTMQRLHPVAIVVLALGLSVQAARWLVPERDRLRLLSRVACWLWVPLAAVAILGLSARLWRPAVARGAASPSMPSIVLIVWDTVRELELSLYEYERPTTPGLERWARRGVVFDRAFATSAWTLPSHASLFTGRLPHELSVDWLEALDAAHPTLAERLARRGYRTAGFVANLTYMTKETGIARGFQEWDDYPVTWREILLNAELVQWIQGWRGIIALRGHDRKPATVVTDAFLNWLARNGEAPFFAFLNYKDAHVVYYAPDSLRVRFRRGRPELDAYDAAIAYLDAETNRLLQGLERRGLLGQTIVVVTSDHGEHFGEHGLVGHANSLYRQVVQVPLVLLAPGRAPAGLRVPQPVSLRSVPATLLDLAGVAPGGIAGMSLARFWREGRNVEQDMPVLSELTPAPRAPVENRNSRGELRSLVQGTHHYIVNLDGSEEIFDLESDPLEEKNLAGRAPTPLLRSVRAQMQVLDSLFPRKKPPGPAR